MKSCTCAFPLLRSRRNLHVPGYYLRGMSEGRIATIHVSLFIPMVLPVAIPVLLHQGFILLMIGVSISKREKCTLSKTRGRADLLIWLHKRIEEKSFESWKVFPLARSSLVSVLSRMLVWPYRPIHLLNVHFSRFDMLTPSMFSPDYYCDPDMHQCMEWNF